MNISIPNPIVADSILKVWEKTAATLDDRARNQPLKMTRPARRQLLADQLAKAANSPTIHLQAYHFREGE